MIIFFSVHKIVTHFSHDRTGSRTLASNLTDHCSPHWAILLWQIIQYCTYIRINIIFDLFFGFFQSSSVFLSSHTSLLLYNLSSYSPKLTSVYIYPSSTVPFLLIDTDMLFHKVLSVHAQQIQIFFCLTTQCYWA